jgi:ribulose 1,5-bisphosphate synthetase/thiazole synthase
MHSVQSLDSGVLATEDVRRNGEFPAIQRESGESILKEVSEMYLPRYSPEQGTMELVIAGAGPSGLAVAARVSQAGNTNLTVVKARFFNDL